MFFYPKDVLILSFRVKYKIIQQSVPELIK